MAITIIGQLALLALPTSLKILTDLYYIKDRKMPITHRSELNSFILWGILVSLINPFLMGNEYPFWVRFIESAIMSSAIFFQFFDWGMGLALHGNPFYLNTTENGAKTDGLLAKLGPINATFLRLWYSGLAYAVYFMGGITQFIQ
jgi:hypothetical protein